MHGLEALGAGTVPEVVVEMEALLMVRHLGHGLLGAVLERFNGTEVL